MKPALKLYLFGGFELTGPEGTVVSIPVKKARALLAWLSMQPGISHSRDKLSTLLWGDATEQQARHSLRQALTALRKSSDLVAHALQASHDTVQLRPGMISVDALELEKQPGPGAREQDDTMLDCLRGEFLEGLNTHSPAFEEWLMDRREQYRVLVSERLERAMHTAMDEERMSDAVRLGIRLVGLEPLREDVHRTLMECYAALGRTPAALQQYRICRATLDKELGVAPSPETELVKRRLLSERSRPGTGELREPRARDPVPIAHRKPQLRQLTLLSVVPAQTEDRHDPEAEEKKIRGLDQQCGTLARRYGLADPICGGHSVLVVFGSPRTSSNDNLRALQFSAQLAERVTARIAVASGRAVVHFDDRGGIERISGALTRQVEALSNASANIDIVLSEAVRLSTVNHARVEGPLPATLPGNVKSWSLRSVNLHRPIRELPGFVGRHVELNQLTMMIDFCRDGDHGHVFTIRGEAGIGKSRLVQKVVEESEKHGDLCVEYFAGSPVTGRHHNLTDCIADLAGDTAGNDPGRPGDADRIRDYLMALGLDGTLVSYAHALFATGDSELRRTFFSSSDSLERDNYGRQLLSDLFARLSAERPVLLVLEDYHLAGPSLTQQLAELAGMTTQHRIILIMTSRFEGEALNPAWRGAASGAPMTTIDLSPLPPGDSRALAEHLAGFDFPRLDDCVTRSGGNPLFLEQLLISSDQGSGALPDSIQSIVDSRLDEMSAGELDTVRAASVLGWRFKTEALRQVLQGEEDHLDSLMARGLLLVAGEDGRFLHELIHRGIRNSMLQEDRRLFHGRAADYYRDLDPFQHARHALEAGRDKAGAIARQAVDEFIGHYEYEKALSLANQMLGTDPGNHALLTGKAKLLHLLGSTREAVEVYKGALRVSSSDDAVVGIVDALIVLDRFDEALEYLDTLDQARDGGIDPMTRARIEILISRIAFTKGYIDRCVEHGEKAAEYARSAGLADLEIESLSTMADAQYQQGQMSRAVELFDRTYQLAAEHEFQHHAAVNLVMAAWIKFYMLRGAEAREEAHRSLDLAIAAGHRRHQAIVLSVLAALDLYAGDYQSLIDHARLGAELARSVGTARFEIECECLTGYAAYQTGEQSAGFKQALASAERMVELRPAYAGPWFLAVAARCAPDADTAMALLRRGEQIFSEMTCVSHNYLHFYDFGIERLLADANFYEAERLTNALESYLAERDIPFGNLCCRRARVLIESVLRSSAATTDSLRTLTTESRQIGLNHTADFCEQWEKRHLASP